MVQPQQAQSATEQFARDVHRGLSNQPKSLPSKYFYDEEGDRLFQQIMAMPEYYLTDCEFEVFRREKSAILDSIGNEPFQLIELGAGDGTKTEVLLEHFLNEKVEFVYRPIDISGNVLEQLAGRLAGQWPQLPVEKVQGDYFRALNRIQDEDGVRKVVLFLGANIGNFPRQDAARFLHKLGSYLSSGDLLLIGFDLKKDPARILAAYNDPAGITAAFNLNLLHRINRELGGNFDPDQFRHWETYNPVTGETKSYLVSLTEQEVQLRRTGYTYRFEAWEAIDVEISLKYSRNDIEELATEAGFSTVKHFTDSDACFIDSLWRKP